MQSSVFCNLGYFETILDMYTNFWALNIIGQSDILKCWASFAVEQLYIVLECVAICKTLSLVVTLPKYD